MIVTTTILAGLYAFLNAHKEDIATKVIASATYDGLKKTLDFSALKKKLGSFFSKEEDSDKFIEALCNESITAGSSAGDALKQTYEQISGHPFNDQILASIKEWLSDSEGAINNLTVVSNTGNSGGFNIGSQNAGRNIYNIQGDYKPKKD
jgi:hypothetical protein